MFNEAIAVVPGHGKIPLAVKLLHFFFIAAERRMLNKEFIEHNAVYRQRGLCTEVARNVCCGYLYVSRYRICGVMTVARLFYVITKYRQEYRNRQRKKISLHPRRSKIFAHKKKYEH